MINKIAFFATFGFSVNAYSAPIYAPWLTQVGINEEIVSSANYGKDVLVGVVDTGIIVNSKFFTSGQISNNLSQCAATSFVCNSGVVGITSEMGTNGAVDDHGHGTKVAGIIAGSTDSALYRSTNTYGNQPIFNSYEQMLNGAVISIAPSANLLGVKVLSKNGSGEFFDVANGIRVAADNGAKVINVSITFSNTYSIVDSINYAASKGAYIVWAGGNSNTSFISGQNTYGLTSEAIKRLVLVGAVDHQNIKAGFSNTAGSGLIKADFYADYSSADNNSHIQKAGDVIGLPKNLPSKILNGLRDRRNQQNTPNNPVVEPPVVEPPAIIPPVVVVPPVVEPPVVVTPPVVEPTVPQPDYISQNISDEGYYVNNNGTSSSYADRWIVAPGEGLSMSTSYVTSQGFFVQGYSQSNGTSFSAPIVAGALTLLQSAWPILSTRGTAIDLLLLTATDLGASGIDSVYGNGLLNVQKAFQPYGALTITDVNGNNVKVADMSGQMLSSGALGNLNAVSSVLADYTAFDRFERNFSVDFSSMIVSPNATPLINPMPTYTRTQANSMQLIGGTTITTWQEVETNQFNRVGEFGFNPERAIGTANPLYVSFNYKDGTAFSLGNGYGSQYGFSEALYNNANVANLASQMTGIATLGEGGALMNYGFNLSNKSRLAFGFSNTMNINDGTQANIRSANNLKIGYSFKANKMVTSAVNVGYLTENNGLLGSQYSSNSRLGFNDSNNSYFMDLSTAINLSSHTQLFFQAGYSMTKGASGRGLILGTSDLISTSYGASLNTHQLMNDQDCLNISIKQPLRLAEGQAALLVTGVDENGLKSFNTQHVNLAPNGRQIDMALAYDTPLKHNESVSLVAQYQQDAQNIQGNSNKSFNVVWKKAF